MKSPMPGTVNAKSPRSGAYASPESMMPFLTRTTSAGGRPSRSAISAELHTLFSSEAMALMYSRSSGRARCQRDSYRPLSSDACAMGSPLMTADNGIGDDSDSSKAAEPYAWMEYGSLGELYETVQGIVVESHIDLADGLFEAFPGLVFREPSDSLVLEQAFGVGA